MKYKLGDICEEIREKILTSDLSEQGYISTDNMIVNRGGIIDAVSLPSSKKVQSFKCGDVLVSNIRPYFKKIWHATFDGGCSNDVLVFRAKRGISGKFLYYTLSDDAFFSYATSTAKGTKMPRGDKEAIMDYPVDLPSYELQEKRVILPCLLDELINYSNQINKNLEEQALALYKQIFPYKISDILPNGWHIGTMKDIISIHDAKRIPLSGPQRKKMKKRIYPYYGAATLMDYVEDYIFDGVYLLLGEDGTVVNNQGFPILQYVWGKFWVNNHAHILTGKNGFNVESLYLLLKNTSVQSVITGAVQPKISQSNLKSIEVVIPPEEILSQFNDIISPLFSLIRSNKEENIRLTLLRDALLPQLISGKIDVSNIAL